MPGLFVQIVALFPFKQAENKQKELPKLFAHTVFIWVGFFWGVGCLPLTSVEACLGG